MFLKKLYTVRQIDSRDSHSFILNIHYAKRLPPVTYAFGLFKQDKLVGICTFSKPTGRSVASYISYEPERVLELNRLVLLNNIKNEASFFISKCLKMIPTESIVISFADTEQNHIGYVYQACNFKYFGITQKKREYFAEGLHSRGACQNRSTNGAILRWRPRKHRYIFITGKKDYSVIKLEEKKYPKYKEI